MFDKMIAQQTAKKKKLLDNFLEKHEAEYPFPEDVELIQNIDYMGDGRPCHFMDVYRPKEYKGRLPIMFYLHGGGFLLGKKEEGHLFCAEMSQKGFLVFSLEYPLAPEAAFGQILQELMEGLENAKAFFQKYDGDAEHIYLTGTSAGATLCIYLSAMLQNQELSNAFGVTPAKLQIRAQGLISGMYYTTKMDSIGIFLPSYIYGKQWKKSTFYPYINPENKAILQYLPPTFLVTAYGDFLQNYSRQYAKAMKLEGAVCHLEDVKSSKKLPHAFSTTFPELPESRQVNEKMVRFLLEY